MKGGRRGPDNTICAPCVCIVPPCVWRCVINVCPPCPCLRVCLRSLLLSVMRHVIKMTNYSITPRAKESSEVEGGLDAQGVEDGLNGTQTVPIL